jgi:hypothetical protein
VKIQIKKLTFYKCEYTITRNDGTDELITLDIKTYLIHDITHFVVEKNLAFTKGFWGMLAEGYKFNQLFGKENLLTGELRFIEKIVGPVQSVLSGHIPKQDFPVYISHLGVDFNERLLEDCINEIKSILQEWEKLKVGECLKLLWV